MSPDPLPGGASDYDDALARSRLWSLVLVLLATLWSVPLLQAIATHPVVENLVVSGVMCGGSLLWVLRVSPHRGYTARELLGPLPRWWQLAPIIGVVLANCAFSVAVVELSRITGVAIAEPDDLDVPGSGLAQVGNVIYLVGYVVLIGPFVEELVFRGVLFRKWRLTLGPVKGLLASGAIFGGLHFGHVLPSLVFGLVLACIYASQRTLWASILAHVLNNGIAVLPALFLAEEPSDVATEEPLLSLAQAIVLLLSSLAVLAWFGKQALATLGGPLPPFARRSAAARAVTPPEREPETRDS